MSTELGAAPPAVFINGALTWLAAHLEHFNPLRNDSQVDDHRQKAVVELAMLCMCLDRQSAGIYDSRLAQELLAFIVQIYNHRSFRERLFRVDYDFVPQVYLAVALSVNGLLDVAYQRGQIQTLVCNSNICSVERPPHRMLELRRLLDWGGFSHRLPSYETLCEQSILTRPLNVLYLTDYDIYSITHALIYLTDVGSQPVVGLSLQQVEYLVDVVDQLIGAQTRRGNWDLVGELLLSSYCLGEQASMLYRLGWQALTDAQMTSGAVPGPYFDQVRYAALERAAAVDYLFAHCYHTTLVAALAGAVCRDSSQR